uniref:Anthocyanidin 3-O-glucoside 5-O-glucosyltransferase 1 n=1 Tax=Perilla frutescens TaxID=48386 RepID=5GT1_PERFR|nr:RecName: Full=Anthocyanidin 3-O-glucoside 5-O-glucosyltransferase 1; AltName: Full=UDP-glucose:anthocyanin 5-O-glucosyltransferase 3R4; Short=p3R4; Flags: Precursor [Perilla frutescens]BAA36421.1 UDP-glucose:anthocysnin 5-O-glucosyltransferase [Perilla frutescens var. crispa]
MVRRRVLLATFPAQGHINPALQFAKRLLKAGTDVTFFTSVYAWRRMANTASAAAGNPPGLDFVAFSDGYDDGLKPCGDGKRYMSEMKARGSEALRNLLLNNHDVTFVVYSHLFAWAAEVARESQVPSALLWVEPATVLCIYYFYFNGYADEIDAGSDEIQLPRLPPLEQRSLPTFLLPETPERFRLMMKEKLETLDGEEKAKVLVNTFDALEPDALTAIDRYELIGIGPLIPSAFLDGGDPSETSYGGDLFEKSEENNCVEWLDTKPKSSVVYVSFGSVLRFPKAQMEEIGKGLLACGRPFLWMIREQKNDDGEEEEEELSCIGELKKMGKIVSWCSQLEVLAHPALGCFVTHCGWNSAVESLSCGVPVVAVPQWFDQTTNAKLIEDAWGTGVRVRMNEGGGVDGSEIERCVEMVMDGGEKSKLVRENAIKWKTLAREAMGEDGSSLKNLNAFLHQVARA